MSLLKGMDIEIFENGSFEKVCGCLVGSPSADGKTYTIGIPKGDIHNWVNKKLRVFGIIFRTIGYPQMGIAENIPLDWDRNVTAEILRTNGNCTIYEKGTYRKRVYHEVFFIDKRGESVTKPGADTADSLTVTIYSACNSDDYIPKKGDIIVPADIEFEFDVSSQQAESASMAEFRRQYSDFAIVDSTQISDSISADYIINAR